MDGFITNLTVPVITLLACIMLPTQVMTSLFLFLYGSYSGYLILSNQMISGTINALNKASSQEEAIIAMGESILTSKRIKTGRAICKITTWIAIVVVITICFL